MNTKNNANALKILIAFALMMFMLNVAFASCDASGASVEFSRNKACAGQEDKIYIYIYGTSGCAGSYFTVDHLADELDDCETTGRWSTVDGAVDVTTINVSEGYSAVKWDADSTSAASLKLTLDKAMDWRNYANLEFRVWSDKTNKLTVTIYNEAGTGSSPWGELSLVAGFNDISLPVVSISSVRENARSIIFSDDSDNEKFVMVFDNVNLKLPTGERITDAEMINEGGTSTFKIPATAPVTGAMQMKIGFGGKVFYKTFKVIERPSATNCFNFLGAPIDCSQACEEKPFERRWQFAQASSLPIHFTFATRNDYTPLSTPSATIKCTNATYGLFKEGVKCCATATKCGCKTCAQSLSNPLWRPYVDPNKTVQDTVFGKQTMSPFKSLNDSGWPGVYYANNGDGTANVTPPNSFVDNNIKAKEFNVTGSFSGCNGTVYCGYETDNITRYTYQWEVDYDIVTTVYSKDDYVPMFVGYNQSPPLDSANAAKQSALTGPCNGNKLCYTEVPMCGDAVCDVIAGERCWNCPADCGGGPNPDKGWLGDCAADIPPKHNDVKWYTNQYGGCSRCQMAEGTVADERGCVIKYKQEGENCTCNAGECGWGNNESKIGGNQSKLECTFDQHGTTAPLEIGKCCHASEVWDIDYERTNRIDINGDGKYDSGACVIPRELAPSSLEITKVSEAWPEGYIPLECCGWSRTDAKWFDIKYKIENLGGVVDETYDASVKFEKEDIGTDLVGNALEKVVSLKDAPFNYERSFSNTKVYPGVPTAGGDTAERIACAFSNKDKCEGSDMYINNTGSVITGAGVKHSFITITLSPKFIQKNYYGHTYPSILTYRGLTCDTEQGPDSTIAYCSDGSTIKLPEDTDAICGGWAVPRDMTTAGVFSYADRQTWKLTWNPLLWGIGCETTLPNSWCPFKMPFAWWTLMIPCGVDCYYEGCS